MKIFDKSNIKIIGKDRKNIIARWARRIILSPEYRNFKSFLIFNYPEICLKSPYAIDIKIACYHDIDAVIGCIFDSLQEAKIIDNDRNILRLHIEKEVIKKGKLGKLIIDIDEI